MITFRGMGALAYIVEYKVFVFHKGVLPKLLGEVDTFKIARR